MSTTNRATKARDRKSRGWPFALAGTGCALAVLLSAGCPAHTPETRGPGGEPGTGDGTGGTPGPGNPPGPGPGGPVGTDPTPTQPGTAPAPPPMVVCTTATASVDAVGRDRHRQIVLDVTLRNNCADSRWFILPTRLPPAADLVQTPGGLSELQRFDYLEGVSRVVIGELRGSASARALLLPAQTSVTLRHMPVQVQGATGATVAFPVAAAQLLDFVGTEVQDLRTWFSGDPQSVLPSRSATIDMTPKNDNDIPLTGSKRTPDGSEKPVLLRGAVVVPASFRIPA